MDDDAFYEAVASIIGADHEGQAFTNYRRTRWNNRSPGRGRYPGYGIVRLFGDTVHVALNRPISLTATIEGKILALETLRNAISAKDKT